MSTNKGMAQNLLIMLGTGGRGLMLDAYIINKLKKEKEEEKWEPLPLTVEVEEQEQEREEDDKKAPQHQTLKFVF